MNRSIGLLELKSVPAGYRVADEMLKAADVKILTAVPVCPGKYIIIITGNVGAVRSSVARGIKSGDIFVVDSHIINNVHEDVIAAVAGVASCDSISSIGVVETISAIASVRAGDIAAKSANVRLMEIRIARGLGGKGFLIFSGEIASVKSAIRSVLNEMGDGGEITSFTDIASPHEDLAEILGM